MSELRSNVPRRKAVSEVAGMTLTERLPWIIGPALGWFLFELRVILNNLRRMNTTLDEIKELLRMKGR